MAIVKRKKVKSPRKISDKLFNEMLKVGLKKFPEQLEIAYLSGDGLTLTGIASDILVEMDIREKTNKNDGEWVEEIQKVAGGKKGYAWCVYAGQVCVAFAEQLTGVVSKLPVSGSCASMRKRMPKELIIKKENLQFGDQAIKKYPDTGLGHYATVKGFKKKYTVAIFNEGNTTQGFEGEQVVREGGGMYRTERTLDKTWVMFARPFPSLKAA